MAIIMFHTELFIKEVENNNKFAVIRRLHINKSFSDTILEKFDSEKEAQDYIDILDFITTD